jgi:hypothetical protein
VVVEVVVEVEGGEVEVGVESIRNRLQKYFRFAPLMFTKYVGCLN